MEKYLLIAMDIDMSAPGIVYGKLIREMQKTCDISIICPSISNDFDVKVKRLPCQPCKKYNFRIERLLFRYWGKNVSDGNWARDVFNLNKDFCETECYDGIISFTSCYNFASLYLGRLLAEYLKTKWIIYSVDAIPAPLDWNPDVRQYNNIIKQLRKIIVGADAFFAANPIMLQYELGLFGTFNGNTGVVLTPHNNTVNKNTVEHSGVSFLYTGNIYGPRKVDSLVEAFAIFSKVHPDSKLTFVGRFFCTISDQYKYLVDEERIVFHGFTEKIAPYYDCADVLIDIAAIHPNDVFLSSKIVNYLPIKKPIIAISGDNSPVRALFGGIPTILQCHHDVEEVYDAMCRSVNLIGGNFADRNDVLHRFAADNVVANFLNEMKNI